MYVLINEDLTNIGGPMGNNSSSIRYRKYFKFLARAKRWAEEEYMVLTGNDSPFTWKRYGGNHNSPDLGYVMYTIRKVDCNEERN